mmetsp:Transcript_6799/g.12106  ORF Transcript_6799/g.12106 Transcript_6799/m.12106 type:complete len:305 (-) Transcript_6799:31-945(-)|eukprot:CAMPEP_0201883902 /NCGR_PEP_ID=MMETSP0902-20130614/16299_1 /ASSEMBLY_ACC=CAM_ASM_000551 /TAXON_ID=420261 /ORGANISM="Thalassiosira antarctica, Strain CCMP982" /LENGTH=304 /DNA_ID=CAMNT_0048412769 /DNA_START=52 /DNA_END=966 /DNA_ORIENTATION=-
MVTRTIKTVGMSSLALLGLVMPNPAMAQFGVGANKRKGAASFEELNKMAADRMDADKQVGSAVGGGLEGMLGDMDLGDMDLGALMKDLDPAMLQELVQEGMKDPAMMEMFSGMQGAMDELLNMDTDQLKIQMEEAMAMLTSSDMQQNILTQKEDVLAMMEAQGTATPEEIAEFRADPAKFEAEMTKAFGQMKEMFNDPAAMDTVVQMMQGFGNIMQDPAAAMSKLGGVLQDALADDDKIEEARLQLLNDPSVAGNKAVSDMFGTDEMQDILNDPVKWKKSVKEGQRMLMGDEPDAAGSIGMGEL